MSSLLQKRRGNSPTDMVLLSRHGTEALSGNNNNGAAATPKNSGILHLLNAVCPKFISNTLFLATVVFLLLLISSYRLISIAFDYSNAYQRFPDTQSYIGEKYLNSNVNRLHDYCPLQTPTGSDGTISTSEISSTGGLSLKYLLITIRHGDRSAIHKMPGSSPIGMFPNENHLLYLEPDALSYRDKMSSFSIDKISDEIVPTDYKKETKIESITKSETNEREERKIYGDKNEPDSLNSTTMFEKSDFSLDQGQLTTRGFMQHILLGKILKKSYSTFLEKNIKSQINVVVRSTKYDRTIQSVAALLTTLLSDVISVNKKASQDILFLVS